MEYRELGSTGLKLSSLSFGASSLGQEFRQVDSVDAMQCVHVALDLGMNFIDTSPFYGRGMSEVLLGVALRDVEIIVEAGAELSAGGIYLIAQAEDRDGTALLGINRQVTNFIIAPLLSLVNDLVAFPVQILFKQSEATVSQS